MNIMDIINIPFGAMLKFFNKLLGNQYVLALLMFAVIIEVLLLFIFGIRQQKNSIKQARLRPKENAIRKRYKGREDSASKQKMQMEIQEMYQKEGYNPMSGCLPMLIQFPIIIALYNIVMNPLKYICNLTTDTINGIMSIVNSYAEYAEKPFTSASRNIDLMSAMKKIIEKDGMEVFEGVEGFADKITSIEDLPDLTLFGGRLDLGGIPSVSQFNLLLLIPVLTFVVYFVSMKVNRKLMYQPAQDAAMGCSNKIMDFFMPAMSVVITFGVPGALGVYWIFKCLIGMLKQFLLNLVMPIPKFTEEQMKEAEKEYESKAPKMPERQLDGKKHRSLHYIDAEEDGDGTDAPSDNTSVNKNVAHADESGKSSILGRAELKDYDNRHEDKNSSEGAEASDKSESDSE